MGHKHQEIQFFKTRTIGISPTTIKKKIMNRIRAGFKNKHNHIPTSPSETPLATQDPSQPPETPTNSITLKVREYGIYRIWQTPLSIVSYRSALQSPPKHILVVLQIIQDLKILLC